VSRDQWAAVDDYFIEHLVPADEILDATLAASAAAGLPDIQVSPPQGRLLRLLAEIRGARSILEIGTLGGYSTICLARGMAKDGSLTTLEIDPKHADVARANFALAGLADVIDLRLGPALDTLPELDGPFDLIFIDADRPSYPQFLPLVLSLSRAGTVIVADNVVRKGAVVDPNTPDAGVRGVRQFIEDVSRHPRLDATLMQTVGVKGYDGFTLARVIS